MKPTGIVRRIDDLGRVVIPKEIRKKTGICEGEALEIYIDKNMVGFKKLSYNPVSELNMIVNEIYEDARMKCNEYSDKRMDIARKIDKIIKELREIEIEEEKRVD